METRKSGHSLERDIHGIPLRDEDFNESRDLRLQDSYGNSAEALFQQHGPPRTYGVPEQRSTEARKCVRAFGQRKTSNQHMGGMFGMLGMVLHSIRRCL